MSPHDLKITMEIEPVVKLECMRFNCKFNYPRGNCNLKYVHINKNGVCADLDEASEEWAKEYIAAREGEDVPA